MLIFSPSGGRVRRLGPSAVELTRFERGYQLRFSRPGAVPRGWFGPAGDAASAGHERRSDRRSPRPGLLSISSREVSVMWFQPGGRRLSERPARQAPRLDSCSRESTDPGIGRRPWWFQTARLRSSRHHRALSLQDRAVPQCCLRVADGVGSRSSKTSTSGRDGTPLIQGGAVARQRRRKSFCHSSLSVATFH